MGNTLNSLQLKNASAGYNSPSFRRVIEDHMHILRADPSNQFIPLSPMQLYKNEFDLLKLFQEIRIDPNLYWIVMRMNFLKSMRDVPKDLPGLNVPDGKKISRMLQRHMAVQKINW